ncbi:MAG: hypothetical protein ACE5G1_11935 [bacterium]
MDWSAISEWFWSLGEKYNVNPLIFGSIYVGAIPFFTLSVAWIVRSYKNGKSIVVPVLCAGFFFISAYLYLIIAGRNVPLWVYGFVIALIIFGAVSTVRKVRSKISDTEST